MEAFDAIQEPAAPRTVPFFTVMKVPGGWVHVTATITLSGADGAKVEDIVFTQPNLKPIALEAFKLSAVNWWVSKGATE